MMREAGPADRHALEGLLQRRIDLAMFPLSNLRVHGLGQGGFASDHPHASRFWLLSGDSLVAITRDGMLMAVLAPDCGLSGLRRCLAGMTVSGAVGPAQSIRPLLQSLGLAEEPALKDADEPGLALDLVNLRLPELPGATLMPGSAIPRDLLVQWRAASLVETQGLPVGEASAQAERHVEGWLQADSHRVLLADGQPVALTGFNARLPEIVQVGGVYTPPALRSRGYARQAVALHLEEARAAGVTRSVLFAASEAAVRAYLAIGFRPAADFALVLFRDSVTLRA